MLTKTTELLEEFFVKKSQDIFRENELLQLSINYCGAPLVSDEQYTDKDEVFNDSPTISIVRPDGYIGALIGSTFGTFATLCRHNPALIKDGFPQSWPVTITKSIGGLYELQRWQYPVFHSMSVNVLIVGAGPSGLSLALLLLRNGLSVRIVEKQLQFHPGERGAGIQPRTLELYKLLGILPDIIERSSPPPTNLRSFAMPDDGKPPNLTPIAQSLVNTPDRPLINARMLGQNRQEQLLRERILADYGIQVELGAELKSFEQQPDHVVAHVVKIVDSKIVEESFTVDWLVGADGARGVVRKQLGLTFLGESPEMDAVTGDIHVLGDSLDHLDFSIWRQSDQAEPVIVSMRPCAVQGKNLYQFLIGGGKRKLDIDKISSSRQEMVKAFHELTGRRDIEFGQLVWMGLWRPNIRMVDRFGEGRVFLVGDAAHVHSPTGGQGMNSSVQDSFNLAWKLTLAQKKFAPQSLLDSYSQERLPVIAAMLNKTTELFQKEFVGKAGQKQEFVRGYELRQLGINYRGAPLVSDEKFTDKDEVNDPYRSGDDGTARAGDRAPDAPCLAQLGVDETSSTISLFDLLNTTQHSALVFPGSTGRYFADEVIGTLREYPSNLLKSIFILPRASDSASSFTLVDTEGHAYSGYHVAHDTPTVFIVRPDGYIGALVTSGRLGIRNYFSRIFL